MADTAIEGTPETPTAAPRSYSRGMYKGKHSGKVDVDQLRTLRENCCPVSTIAKKMDVTIYIVRQAMAANNID